MTGSSAHAIVLTLVAPATARQGDRVPLRLVVLNRSAHALDLYLRGRDVTFDVTVHDGEGRERGRLLEGATIPAIVQLVPLAPGEALERTLEWDQRTRDGMAAPGDYALHAALLTDTEALRAPPVSLRILPR